MNNLEPMKCDQCGKNIIVLSSTESGCEDNMCRRVTYLENKYFDSQPITEIDVIDNRFSTFLFGPHE